MKRVKRTYRGETKNHPIYTQKEAAEAGIEWVYWKEATEAGQWAISDDGWVAEVLGVNGPYPHSSGPTRQIVFPYCRMFTSPRASIAFEAFYGKGNYSSSAPETWVEEELRKNRAQRVVRTYAALLLKKGRLTDEDFDKLGRIYRPKQKIPRATLKRLLKQPETKKMVREELVTLLSENDITPDKLIKDYKKTYQRATKDSQHGVAKSVLDTFRDMLDMMPDKAQPKLPEGGTDADLIGLLESERTEVVDDDHDQELLDEQMDVTPDVEALNGDG